MNTAEHRPTRTDHQYVNLFISKFYITISSLLSHACQGSYLLFTERLLKRGWRESIKRRFGWRVSILIIPFPVLIGMPSPCLCNTSSHWKLIFFCAHQWSISLSSNHSVYLRKKNNLVYECYYDFIILQFSLTERNRSQCVSRPN